ncbi:unnamed protein product [Oreochromis niloticus]|nr:unnamed protein product [Mustela putorius furo]
MAAASVSEDSLRCPICLSVFTKPVTIPCGHNFCLDCITEYWSTLSVLQCPLCKETFYTRPLLRVNPVIAEMAEKVKNSVQEMFLSSAERAGTEDVLCSMCAASQVRALKSCLMCLVSYCQTHLEPHQRISALKKHKLIDPVKNLESRVCQHHSEPLELIYRLDQMFLCRSCKCGDHKKHKTVSLEDEAEMRKTQLRLENNSMDQMIQEHEQKIQEVQQSVKTSRSKAEEALLYSRKVTTTLVQHIKTEFTRLSEAIEFEQKINETEAESFINELQGEITHMKKKKLQLHEASLIRDPFSFLENVLPLTYNKPQLKDWSAVTVTSDQFMIQETLAKLETAVREEVSMLREINFRDGKQQHRMAQMDLSKILKKHELRSEQQEDELSSLTDKSALNEKEKEIKMLHDRITEMGVKHDQTRSAVEENNKDLKSLKERLAEMGVKHDQTRSAVVEEELKSVKERLREMEVKYDQTRAALNDKDEELKSFKDRVAREVALSLKTGKNAESMNNPVSKTRLIQMYEELRLEWPKVKKHLKSNNGNSESVRVDIQVEEFRLLTVQNLQLAVYHTRTQPDPKAKDETPQNVVEQFNSECYWLGCLMALNGPPLHPDWDNHVPGMDAWDIFPRKTAAVAVSNNESFC